MAETHEPRFESPGFFRRIRSIIGVDFYRLFHTPMYFIFLVIAALIPALILSTAGMQGPDGTAAQPLYTNTWNIVAADTPLYVVRDIGDYANLNMVYIFGGIMVSIFIGHDYSSGYVKQLFTTHARKRDYMISKALTGAFSMACMCGTYLAGAMAAGLISGTSFEVHPGSLMLALAGKVVLSLGWSALYTFLNVIFRRYFGISVLSCFLLGTGIPVIGAAAVLGESSLLNLFLYGSSVYACLGSTPSTLLTCTAVSAGWAVIYILLGSFVLSRSDIY